MLSVFLGVILVGCVSSVGCMFVKNSGDGNDEVATDRDVFGGFTIEELLSKKHTVEVEILRDGK